MSGSSSRVPGPSLCVTEAATGRTLAELAVDGPSGAGAAARRARDAWDGWARTAAAERSACLKRAAMALRERVDRLAELQTREMGKPLADSRGGVLAGIGAMEQYAELGPVHRGRSLHGAWGALDLMVHEPRGVAAVIVPWNDPVAIALQGIAANLAVGNAVVVKPSERAPLAVLEAVDVIREHVPADVLVPVIGAAAEGWALVEHDDVDLVLHTGSVATGRRIAERCGGLLRKAILELGGKDPVLVDAGVDPVWAADAVATAAFANAGQLCVSAERVLVHEAVAEPFLAALVARAEQLRVGDPLDPATQMGPLVDDAQVALVAGHVEDAVRRGARLLAGGHRLERPGSFFAPTVLADVPIEAATWQEETFGPVAPVRVVGSFAEALAGARHPIYGLAAIVLTPSLTHAQEAVRTLRAGTVKVNAPFGGAPGGAAHPRGASGTGFGYGPELLDELTAVKVVHLEPHEVEQGAGGGTAGA